LLRFLPVSRYLTYKSVFNAIDVIFGFASAHERALTRFSSFTPEDIIKLTGVHEVIEESIREVKNLKEKFPRIVMIARSCIAARVLIQEKKKFVLQARNKGYINPDHAFQTIDHLNTRLGEISSLSRSLRLSWNSV
jgi:hypothetical protein